MKKFTLEFDLKPELEEAPKLIKLMLNNKDITLGEPKKARSYTTKWLDWFWNDTYLKKLGDAMLFNPDQSNWPCYTQGDDMLEKLELEYPGFSKQWDEETKTFVDRYGNTGCGVFKRKIQN